LKLKIAISIVDWDMVVPVPLKLAARSIEETMFQWSENWVKLSSEQAQLFQTELTRIEKTRSSSDQISQLFLDSEENCFLFDVLSLYMGIEHLERRHPRILKEALHRSTETLAMATAEWKTFSDEVYGNRGLAVPDLPEYVEIQETLGLYGRTQLERTLRKMRRKLQRRWNLLFHRHPALERNA
jgi:hypothetical protein